MHITLRLARVIRNTRDRAWPCWSTSRPRTASYHFLVSTLFETKLFETKKCHEARGELILNVWGVTFLKFGFCLVASLVQKSHADGAVLDARCYCSKWLPPTHYHAAPPGAALALPCADVSTPPDAPLSCASRRCGQWTRSKPHAREGRPRSLASWAFLMLVVVG